jgi:glutamate/tyrosine decarboxylase-like PLP-dependent enzyme
MAHIDTMLPYNLVKVAVSPMVCASYRTILLWRANMIWGSFAGPEQTALYLSDRLRYHGWLVPASTMPCHCEDLIVQRIVVKEGFSRDMADLLLGNMRTAPRRKSICPSSSRHFSS